MDRTYPTQRADRRHPLSLGWEPSAKKERRKTTSGMGMEKNSASRAKDHQHDLAEMRRKRQKEVRIQGSSSRGKEKEYLSSGAAASIDCQYVFFSYGTKQRKHFAHRPFS